MTKVGPYGAARNNGCAAEFSAHPMARLTFAGGARVGQTMMLMYALFFVVTMGGCAPSSDPSAQAMTAGTPSAMDELTPAMDGSTMVTAPQPSQPGGQSLGEHSTGELDQVRDEDQGGNTGPSGDALLGGVAGDNADDAGSGDPCRLLRLPEPPAGLSLHA